MSEHWAEKELVRLTDVVDTPAQKNLELTEYNRVKQTECRQRKAEKKSAETAKYASAIVPSKTEAKEYLQTRIVNQHVVDVCYDLGLIAAERHGVSPNKFFWLHGLQKSLESRDQRQEQFLDLKHDDVVDGEVIHLGDLYALYDYSISWREPISFHEFLAERRLCKTDALHLGRILGKDFREAPEGPHGAWRDFYPRLNPTLKPGYDQEQMKEWLDQQSPVKDRLLMASRNAYKSSWNIVWLITPVLCCPDIRLLLVSETNKLSKGFIRGFRSYFETNLRNPSRFNQLFAEHMIPPGDGSTLTFESPMRVLSMIQHTAEATSMESTVAGQRADIIVFDDPISDKNTGTDEQCEKGVATFDAIQKLREVGGYTVVIGTPWVADVDLYAVLVRRTALDDITPEPERMQIRIDPAWTVKYEARQKDIRQLVEDDVVLLFPSRLTWKFLQKELRANESFFKSQNLCIFPKDDDGLKVTFNEEDLRARVRAPLQFERYLTHHTVLAVDPSFSVARTADFSALAILKIVVMEDRFVCIVLDVQLERLKQSELAKRIVDMAQKYDVTRIVVEKLGSWQDLQSMMTNWAMHLQFPLPHVFFESSSGSGVGGPTVRTKAARIKGLETLLAENKLFFAPGAWNDLVFKQFVHFDGVRRSGSSDASKDDAPDCIALGCKIFLPRYQADANSAVQQEAEEQARVQEFIRQQHRRMFGDQQPDLLQPFRSRFETEQEFEQNRLYDNLGRFGMVNRAA